MTNRTAALVTLAGGTLVVAGLLLIYPPLGIAVAGVGLIALGLDDRRPRA